MIKSSAVRTTRSIFATLCLFFGSLPSVYPQTRIPLPDISVCNDLTKAGEKILAGNLTHDPDIINQMVTIEKGWIECGIEELVRDSKAVKNAAAIVDLSWAEGIWINDFEIVHKAGWALASWEVLELKITEDGLHLSQKIFRPAYFPESTETIDNLIELASGTVTFDNQTAISGKNYQRRMVFVERNRYTLDRFLDLSRINFFGRTKWARGSEKLIITDYLEYQPKGFPRTRTFTKTSRENLAIISGFITYKTVSSFVTRCLHNKILQPDGPVEQALKKANLNKRELIQFYNRLVEIRRAQTQLFKSASTPLIGQKEVRKRLIRTQEQIYEIEDEKSFKTFHELITGPNGNPFDCKNQG